MPIYEFVCESCGAPFEELTRSYTAIAEVRCPHCGGDRLPCRLRPGPPGKVDQRSPLRMHRNDTTA